MNKILLFITFIALSLFACFPLSNKKKKTNVMQENIPSKKWDVHVEVNSKEIAFINNFDSAEVILMNDDSTKFLIVVGEKSGYYTHYRADTIDTEFTKVLVRHPLYYSKVLWLKDAKQNVTPYYKIYELSTILLKREILRKETLAIPLHLNVRSCDSLCAKNKSIMKLMRKYEMVRFDTLSAYSVGDYFFLIQKNKDFHKVDSFQYELNKLNIPSYYGIEYGNEMLSFLTDEIQVNWLPVSNRFSPYFTGTTDSTGFYHGTLKFPDSLGTQVFDLVMQIKRDYPTSFIKYLPNMGIGETNIPEYIYYFPFNCNCEINEYLKTLPAYKWSK